jgi:hypothetical protein
MLFIKPVCTSPNTFARADDILFPFVALSDKNEIVNVCFQQDGTIAHTANKSRKLLDEVLGERTTSKGIWPQRSPDLTTPHFFFWGAEKAKVYLDNPHALDELKLQLTCFRSQ